MWQHFVLCSFRGKRLTRSPRIVMQAATETGLSVHRLPASPSYAHPRPAPHSLDCAGRPRLQLYVFSAAVSFAMLLVSGASAQSSAVGESPSEQTSDELSETAVYTKPPEPNGWRAILEMQGIFLTGVMYYIATSALEDWDLQYTWEGYEDKLTGQSLRSDENHFGTNFIGHPLGGTGYYQAARTNHFSVYQSAAFAFGGSLLWEYFGELREYISVNDMITTPMSGWAIGESLYQLGAFFDRSEPSQTNRVLGSVFGPLKSINDWADDLEPARTPFGFPPDEWHRFDLEAGVAFVHEQNTEYPNGEQAVEGRFRLSERIIRLPDFDGSGVHGIGFGDANASGMSLEGAIGSSGLQDLTFIARAVLAGYYQRAASECSGDVCGAGGFVGVGIGYEYSLHDWTRSRAGVVDYISTVQPLSLVFEHELNFGGVDIHSHVEGGPSFGGLQSLALHNYAGPRELLPNVTRLHGYYLGLGGSGTAGLTLNWRALEFAARLDAEAYQMVDPLGGGERVSMAGTRGRMRCQLGYRIDGSPSVLRANLERRVRGSTITTSHEYFEETAFGLAVAAVY